MADTGKLEKTELYLRYRPKTLDQMVGQPDAIRTIRGFGKKIPHAIMIVGPSGTGKTTMARAISRTLDISDMDYSEINCAAVNPMDMVRDIRSAMTASAMGGTRRGWVLDEIQAFSRSHFAQEGLLKILEDGPPHVHFFLCTTDPKKILGTIRSRCSQIVCKSIPKKDLTALVRSVVAAEGVRVSDEVIERIVESADGSGRTALVELEKILGIEDGDEQLAAISRIGLERAAFDLVRVLIPWTGTPKWRDVAKVLEDLKEEDPEGLRCMIMASARAQLLKNASPFAYKCIRCMETPFYDRASGNALLAAAAFQICFGKSTES